MEIHWEDSYLSEVFTGASLSKNSLHPVLEDVGQDRQGIAEFLRSFVCGNENLLIDLTHIFPFDQKIPLFYRV